MGDAYEHMFLNAARGDQAPSFRLRTYQQFDGFPLSGEEVVIVRALLVVIDMGNILDVRNAVVFA